LLLIANCTGDDSFCYKFVVEDSTWHEARAKCESEEGRLSSIHSPSENAFVTIKMKSKYVDEGWIGLNDLNTDNSFEWVDESPPEFFYWAPYGFNEFFFNDTLLKLSNGLITYFYCKVHLLFSFPTEILWHWSINKKSI